MTRSGPATIPVPHRLSRRLGSRAIPVALDLAIAIALVAAAAIARSVLDYRTAFVDEGITLYEGTRVFNGELNYLHNYYLGWTWLTAVPLAIVNSLGGLEAARGVNAALGVATVLVVLLLARRAYGPVAGYVAGGIFAFYAPALFISTFANYDSLSVFLVALGALAWVRAYLDGRFWLYPAGSLALALAVLAKYAAGPVLAAGSAYAVAAITMYLLMRADEPWPDRGAYAELRTRLAWRAVIAGLPLLIVPLYAVLNIPALTEVWNNQVLSKRVPADSFYLELARQFVVYLGVPVVMATAGLFYRNRGTVGLGLLALGTSMLAYHLYNRDDSTFYKHTVTMLVGFAPLAGAGVVVAGGWLARRWRPALAPVLAGALGLAVVAAVGVPAPATLASIRAYIGWSDVTELIPYLQPRLSDGDLVLMEQGKVASYYLITEGVPGHIPADVADTWFYIDDEGQGWPAYERAIREQRFRFIVFDDVVTPQFNERLLEVMEGRYVQVATIPARDGRRYRVFEPVSQAPATGRLLPEKTELAMRRL